MSISGALVGKTIGGIAVTALATFGGYNYATTGCVTGMGCSSGVDASGVAVLPVAEGAESTTAGDSCCSLGDAAAEVALVVDETKDSCCSLEGAAAEITQVAEKAEDSCCSLEAAPAAVSTVALEGDAAGSCCSEAAEGCCSDAASCPADGCDKDDCCKKTEG